MKIQLPDYLMEVKVVGQGQPVLLIHGYPLSSSLWEPQIHALSPEYQVITPDLRGHGLSEPTPGPYSMDQLAQDCAALLDRLEIRTPVVVCGLSMGGYIAFAFHRLFPQRVAGLVLAATRAGADTEEGKAKREKDAEMAAIQGSAAITEGMLPKMFSPKTYPENSALVSSARKMMEKTSVEGIRGALLGMKDRPSSEPDFASIQVPVLVLYGEDDQIIPRAEAEKMAAEISNAQLVVIPNSGHLLNLEQPEQFNRALLNFLASLPGSGQRLKGQP